MKRVKPVDGELEDITGATGWMYTDLFVGLMVIFLATITFIPENFRAVDTRAIQTYTEVYPTPLANKYTTYDYPTIQANMKSFAKKNGFEGAETVARLQVVVSYNPQTETLSQAIQRATEISDKLKADDPKMFAETVTLLNATPEPTQKYFVLEFTFNRFVQVLAATPKSSPSK